MRLLSDPKLKRKLFSGFLGLWCLLALTACGPTSEVTPSPTLEAAVATPGLTSAKPLSTSTRLAMAAEEDNIRELILRYRFQHDIGGLTPQGKIYFIAFTSDTPFRTQRRDPGDEFLKRFQGSTPPVKKVSEAEITADAVKDKTTGEPGTIFGVGNFRWLNDDEVEVEGNWYEAGMNQGGNTFQVKRQNNQWAITGTKGGWIT